MEIKTHGNIGQLRNHYILCGAGRTGMNIVEPFCETASPFVVIEQDEEIIENLSERIEARGLPLFYVQGDATEDETLVAAGIKHAAGFIASLGDDKDNLFATLTARSLNANLRIVTRVNDDRHNREKMFKAGANRVISTDAIGGMRIASEMIRPEVVRFLDQMSRGQQKEKTLRFTELPLSDIELPELATLIEASRTNPDAKIRIKDIGRYTGLLVVAIKSPEEPDNDAIEDLYQMKKRYRFTPRGDVELHPNDVLVIIGTQDTLDEITRTDEVVSNAVDAA